jgi:hypothetical protein
MICEFPRAPGPGVEAPIILDPFDVDDEGAVQLGLGEYQRSIPSI